MKPSNTPKANIKTRGCCCGSEARNTASAPAVYRPQPVPKVLQKKSVGKNAQPALPVHVRPVAQAKFSVGSTAVQNRSSVLQMSHKKQVLMVKVVYQYKDPATGKKVFGKHEEEVKRGRAQHVPGKVEAEGCAEAVATVEAGLPVGHTDFTYECSNFAKNG